MCYNKNVEFISQICVDIDICADTFFLLTTQYGRITNRVKAGKEVVEMNYSFFALVALCVTALALVAMVLCFCYKQNKSVSLKGKAKATKDEISSEIALDIDTKKKTSRQKRN